MYGEEFPWIKFAILSIPLTILMLIFAPGMKWKLLYVVAVQVGVFLALSGRSIKGVSPWTRKGY